MNEWFVSHYLIHNIHTNLPEEVLYAEVKALDVNDLVSLARDVTKLDIPQPPNFLDFEDVKLYVCPTGTTIGTVIYPQGFSFAAAMVIFGKRADVAVAISNTDIKIAGGVDNFSLGPLIVRGQHGPRATVDIQVGTTTQKAHIDGLVWILSGPCLSIGTHSFIRLNFSMSMRPLP